METRVERYKRRKREKRIKRRNRLILLLIIAILILSLNIVDKSYRTFLCIQNQKLFDYDYEDDIHIIHLLGNTYLIEQKRIDLGISQIKESINSIFLELKNRFRMLTGQSEGPVF
jgi:hypothetical protein